ncbi:MAG: ABC transporter permease [Rhizobiales bacterium]|nr:ABC transporter permease [Hyphomicrobiales bacterium]
MLPALARAWRLLLGYGFLIVLAAVFAFFSLATDSFLTIGNVLAMLHAMAPLVIISCGMALVVMAGKLDISVGSIAFLSCAAGVILMREMGVPALAAAVIILAVGALLGAVNGLIVVVMRVNPLIATLGAMIAFRGLALELTGARSHTLPDGVRELGNASIGPVFIDILVAAVVLVAAHIVHQRTPFGRQVTAIGNGDQIAARVGIPVGRVVFLAFVLSGLLAALGGIVASLQVGAVTAYLGKGLEFSAVAVVVVGGISLFGGRGSILQGVALGALVFEMIRNGLNHLGADPYSYRLVGGAVIFVAMYADALKAGIGTRVRG